VGRTSRPVSREEKAAARSDHQPCPRTTLDAMLRLLGIPVSDDDARHLIATLLVEGTPDALSAAAMIGKGVERGR